ncbi:hypothetical protein MNBD_GAMMA12-3350 [hydrothermal vent metagenome]|uniref:Histidine kinase n=1 Tax=hydrothermal vent metagenome TaxID=652676 RepID=A0A3B0YYC5_9ZZZZ
MNKSSINPKIRPHGTQEPKKEVPQAGTETNDIVSNNSHRCVLIVDDDSDFATIMFDLLSLEGYQVQLANNATEAKQILTHFMADVALVDLRLGQDSGIELVNKLQQQSPELLCVMMTAYADFETAIMALRHGAYDYLCKPFHPEKLMMTLRRSFEHIEVVRAKIVAEDALRRSQKMEAVGQLAGGIAHDFNNQLGVIIGYLDFLKEHHAGGGKPQQWVNTASRATSRCIDLTQQLLNFSRKQKNEQIVIDLNQELVKMDSLITHSVTPSIQIESFPEKDLWSVTVDPGELQDALLNLILNARDAMPNGGKLLIKTNNKVVDQNQAAIIPGLNAGHYVQVIIRDTGQGMDKAIMDRIFDPFFTTKPTGEGTGLGLAMVYGFTKRYNGHINVKSTTGLGTTFYLYLPRTKNQKKPVMNAVASDNCLPRGAETVLIVDDEPELLRLADLRLSNLGYHTLLAENAKQALKYLDSHKDIDLLFADIVMPGGTDGYTLAAQAVKKLPKLKVLLTSGYAPCTTQDKLQNSFTQHLLHKPYGNDELAHSVRTILDKQLRTSEAD